MSTCRCCGEPQIQDDHKCEDPIAPCSAQDMRTWLEGEFGHDIMVRNVMINAMRARMSEANKYMTIAYHAVRRCHMLEARLLRREQTRPPQAIVLTMADQCGETLDMIEQNLVNLIQARRSLTAGAKKNPAVEGGGEG